MSQLKLTADGGGGTVAIKAPASTTGNAALDLIVPGTASATLDTLKRAGNILQVVQSIKTDTQSNQTQTYVDVASLAPSITPASSSNKILVNWSIAYASNAYVTLRLKRDSDNTILLGETAGSRERATQASYAALSNYYLQYFVGMYLDSPNTTSAITYKPQLATVHNSSYIWYVNRTALDNDSNFQWRTTSTMTLMEVAA